MTEMHFEKTHSTHLEGVPPHLDLECTGTGLKPLVIEGKFTEPYHRQTKRAIKDKYLDTEGLWAKLPKCKELIKHIRAEEQGKTSFVYLDVPQLLKHILGAFHMLWAKWF